MASGPYVPKFGTWDANANITGPAYTAVLEPAHAGKGEKSSQPYEHAEHPVPAENVDYGGSRGAECPPPRGRMNHDQGSLGSVRSNRPSVLATQLQQAWLQSQIAKNQKRSSSTLVKTPAEKRASYQASHRSSSAPLSSMFPDPTSNQNVFAPDQLVVFHNARCAPFPERPGLPMLVSCSRKTELPQRSRSASFMEGTSFIQGTNSLPFSSLPSQRLQSLLSCSSPQSASQPNEFHNVLINALGSEDKVALNLAGQRKPLLSFVDEFCLQEEEMEGQRPPRSSHDNLCLAKEMEENRRLMQKGGAYEAVEQELVDLVAPDFSSHENCDLEVSDYDTSWVTTIISPTEEGVTDKLIHAYTCNLSKHVMDVSICSESMDSNTWIDEKDTCNMDDVWESYLNSWQSRPALSLEYGQYHPCRGDSNLSFEACTNAPPPCGDLTDLLLRCANVVNDSNVKKFKDLIGELRQRSSAYGSAPQRMAYYFMEALVAKMSGTGAQLHTALTNNCPSAVTMIKCHRLFVDFCPYLKVSHFFSTKAILDAFAGASHVHVIDYGILDGVQWPCLIQHLAQRPEGPPHLRLTGYRRGLILGSGYLLYNIIPVGHVWRQGIGESNPTNAWSDRVHKTGRRLEEFAKMWNVSFEYQALVEKWETITPTQLALRHDEVVAVNCVYKLRHLLDESIMAASPRKRVLDRIRSMNPKVFVEGVISAGCNAPFFMNRFRESVKYFSTMFDAMEVSIPTDDPDRVVLEQEIYGREILNIVACEGLERVERAEPYRQWQSRTQRAGFTQMPLKPIIVKKIKAMMASYHKDYGVGEDGGWFLMGWKNHIVRALSVWEPTPGLLST